jgi:hypothetical protein
MHLLLQSHNSLEAVGKHIHPLCLMDHQMSLTSLQLSDPHSCLYKVSLHRHVVNIDGAQVVSSYSQHSNSVDTLVVATLRRAWRRYSALSHSAISYSTSSGVLSVRSTTIFPIWSLHVGFSGSTVESSPTGVETPREGADHRRRSTLSKQQPRASPSNGLSSHSCSGPTTPGGRGEVARSPECEALQAAWPPTPRTSVESCTSKSEGCPTRCGPTAWELPH